MNTPLTLDDFEQFTKFEKAEALKLVVNYIIKYDVPYEDGDLYRSAMRMIKAGTLKLELALLRNLGD